jgi:hypothetical protein
MDSNKLEHDPRTKQLIKDALYAYLYQPVERQFKSRLDTLIVRNTLMGGFTHKHFTYKGNTYNADASPPPVKKNRLLPALRADMEEYLSDLDKLNYHELPYVLGFMNKVLNSSSDLTDYFRVLPEAIHQPLQKLKATCPCQTTTLSKERVEKLVSDNTESINLMKQRLVTNLLI